MTSTLVQRAATLEGWPFCCFASCRYAKLPTSTEVLRRVGEQMANKTTPVTEADKDKPGVFHTTAEVPGVGTVDLYVKVERVDDVDGTTTEDVQTLRFAVPVWVEPEEDSEEDSEGHWSLGHKEIHLGKAQRDNLAEALESFVKVSRDYTPTAVATQPLITASNPALSEWLRRVRKWLEENRAELGIKSSSRGRLKAEYQEIYVKDNPDDPRPA